MSNAYMLGLISELEQAWKAKAPSVVIAAIIAKLRQAAEEESLGWLRGAGKGDA
jgi:hypothetical protein